MHFRWSRPIAARALPTLVALVVVGSAHAAAPPRLLSPDGKTEVRVEVGDTLRYSVLHAAQATWNDPRCLCRRAWITEPCTRTLPASQTQFR